MNRIIWFNIFSGTNNLVQVADQEGEEYKCHVVFEMMLVSKQSAGQRDVKKKLLFMDEVSGFHYVIKVFHTKKVIYSEENGLMCSNPTLPSPGNYVLGALLLL